jgi:hypothetical protein
MLEVVAGAVSVSAAEAGAEVNASAAAESDKALMTKIRMDGRPPLRAIFFFLLVMRVLLVTSRPGRLKPSPSRMTKG